MQSNPNFANLSSNSEMPIANEEISCHSVAEAQHCREVSKGPVRVYNDDNLRRPS